MLRYSIVDIQKGEVFDCYPVFNEKGGQQRSRNRKTIEAFMRYCRDSGGKVGWWTFGVDYGPGENKEGYIKFQKALDYFIRTIPGKFLYGIEVGEHGGKLHVHALFERYYDIHEMKEKWLGATGLKYVNVDVATIPGRKKLSDGVYRDIKDDESVAYYIAKYATKTQDSLKGARCFRTSKFLRGEISEYFQKEGFTFFLSKEFYDSKIISKEKYDSSDIASNLGEG